MYELHFNSELKFSKSSGTFKVGGVSVKSGFIKNKHFIIPKSELKNIAETLKGSYLLTDHSRSVKDVIGEVTKTKIIENKVLYEATLTDSGISEKIKTGLLKNSSVGLQVERLQCSICGCEYGACYHQLGQEYDEAILEAKEYSGNVCAIFGTGIRAREQSIVLFPAIEGASVGALNFDDETEHFIKNTEAEKEDKFNLLSTMIEKMTKENEEIIELTTIVNTLSETIKQLLDTNEILEDKLSNYSSETQGFVPDDDDNYSSQKESLKENIRETIFKKRRDEHPIRWDYSFKNELHKFTMDDIRREIDLKME